MTLWATVLTASAAAFGLKYAGHVVPHHWLEGPRTRRVTGLLPVALLAALVAVQTFTSGHALGLDARAAGVGVAVVALLLRAPFLAVVVLAAATAGALRAVGLAA
ncbi:AzlD domain-containing protein [Oryzihumus leptocrescens]|uniref:Branched-subunit amino acid transport protein AzlD n=1 Tax=Oryzihumus leptocrescens TaxID=297536 RepID=A0A542ZH89_9MICO|nr:AzlD domain-containing protein [Oryzihumus leptocrescens]TQL59742.1 branched-subunit amino acid transport protein AzlD [Oryzihumus leptocrescens]